MASKPLPVEMGLQRQQRPGHSRAACFSCACTRVRRFPHLRWNSNSGTFPCGSIQTLASVITAGKRMLSSLQKPSVRASARAFSNGKAAFALPARNRVVVRAIDETNFAVNLLASGICGTAAAAVTVVTAEDKDKEIERVQTLEGALPIVAAIGADTIAHSIPGLSVLFSLLSEPAGAAAGVAYMMSLVLSSPAVDPTTLAPKGTIINAEKAKDSRAALRVPFSQVIPTALKVVDTSNDSSSGAGWTIGDNGLPKIPINTVLIVLGVGGTILELLSHAPVLSLFMPRVLQVACWLALAGWALDKRDSAKAAST